MGVKYSRKTEWKWGGVRERGERGRRKRDGEGGKKEREMERRDGEGREREKKGGGERKREGERYRGLEVTYQFSEPNMNHEVT